MKIRRVIVGALEVNCYIVFDEKSKEAIVVDPGDEPDRILDFIKEDGVAVKAIVLTHAHFDHIGGAPEVRDATSAPILLHEADLPVYESSHRHAAIWGFKMDAMPKHDRLLKEGDKITASGLGFDVIHTPGHSPGCICLYGQGIMITGDTLFQGSIGRTDLPGGDTAKIQASFRRLFTYPDATKILPGHGPESDLGRERAENAFSGWLERR